ncbi:cercarial elastase (S01 family) [Schistosoma mansoni]|uniref:cercarial elastase (S01 family) n=1 Tax=Schistosoma mansoni TaxID=6183 RepID=UPI00022C871E|nr:cercarial elastase (S01 family) [Schistosoma mansoni]|eukprot:XP_018647364.1 cercarial elastase (S01 family) [Schistosoma mansoni]
MVTLFTYCLTFERVSTWLVRKGEPVQDRTEFPYIAFVRTERTMCTGSLVSTRAVLTAGHCVCSPMPVVQGSNLPLITFEHCDNFHFLFDECSIAQERQSVKCS